MKLATGICDLVSTGATLEANGLVARDTVFESQAVLIKSPTPPEAELADLLDSIMERMSGVIASSGAKYVMMNAPRAALDDIIAILPGAGSPTIMPLAGREDAVAVHAVCQEAVFWETLEKLKAVGALEGLVLAGPRPVTDTHGQHDQNAHGGEDQRREREAPEPARLLGHGSSCDSVLTCCEC